jgi:hypothetical protein
MAGFNINDFLGVIAEKGILKPNKFRVNLPVPLGLRIQTQNAGFYNSVSRDFEFWCEGAALPSSTIQLHPLQRYGYGPTNRKPLNQVNQDLPLTLLADAQGENWMFLKDWTNLITNWDRQKGFNTNGNPANWEIAYKDDYVVDARIDVFNDIGETVKSVVLVDTYPSLLGELRMDWQDNNSVQRIPLTLTFYDWFNNDSGA